MFANIIASYAIIILPVYFYLRSNSIKVDTRALATKKVIKYTFVMTFIGGHLLYLSVGAMGLRVTLLPLLFTLSTKYFGWKVTVPSMSLVGLGFVYLDGDRFNFPIVLSYLFLTATLYLVQLFIEKKLNGYLQLVVLLTYQLLVTAQMRYFIVEDLRIVSLFFFFTSLFNYLMLTFLYLAINDLRHLHERVDYDYLTHLLNVRKFKERLVKLEKHRNLPISIAVMDIDWFKSFNDKYGHDAGDKILWGVAQVFSAYSTKEVTIYRIGGEEFAIVLKKFTLSEAELVVADIMDNVVNRPIPINRHHSESVTLSVGLVLAEKDETLHKTWKRADYAMYEAKRNGRNQLYVDRRTCAKRSDLEEVFSAHELTR